MENYNCLNYMTEDGEVISKEDFLAEAGRLYEEMTKSAKEEEKPYNFFKELLAISSQVQETNILETFSFCRREIYITQEITPELSQNIYEKIKFWNFADTMNSVSQKERTPIKIYIDTPGGSLQASLSIMDTINASETPVYTVNYGEACSGGFFILTQGHKRFGFKDSTYLFHEGATTINADAHKFDQYSDSYKSKRCQLKELVISKTNITEEIYNSKIKDDWWLNADEALKLGIIDEIITQKFI